MIDNKEWESLVTTQQKPPENRFLSSLKGILMESDIVDPEMFEQESIMGAIWSVQCMNPYHDAVFIGDDLLLVNADGAVTSGIHFSSIQKFTFEA